MFGAGSFGGAAVLCLFFLAIFSISDSVVAAASNLTFATTSESTNNRLNTKNLNRIFKRHFSAVGVPLTSFKVPVPTTTESYNFGEFYPEVVGLKKGVGYRRSDDYQQQQQQLQIFNQDGFAVSSTSADQSRPLHSTSLKPSSSLAAKPVQLFQEIKVSLRRPPLQTTPPNQRQSNQTLPKPTPSTTPSTTTTTSSSRTSEQSRTISYDHSSKYTPASTPPFSSSSFSSIFSSSAPSTTASSAEFEANFVTRPSDQCRCVCRHGHRLESYDIELEELRAKLLQAELLSESKTNRVKNKVEDVLDSLVDEDENDYDDIDELEAIQKPTKYIPMEIIELSHRRPPSKGPTSVSLSSPPTTSTSSTSGRIPLASSSATSTTSSPSSTSTAVAAPAYSVSFAKPVITLKMFATRVVQLGIPLLVTVALGNALTQFELTDRSSSSVSEDDNRRIGDYTPSRNYTPYSPYWNFLQGSPWGETLQLQVPLSAGSGYYAPFYEALDGQQQQQRADNGKPRPLSSRAPVAKRRRLTKTTSTRKQSSSESFWQRWYERLVT